jgi:hypothetical protein
VRFDWHLDKEKEKEKGKGKGGEGEGSYIHDVLQTEEAMFSSVHSSNLMTKRWRVRKSGVRTLLPSSE